jgi:hypothetical protein
MTIVVGVATPEGLVLAADSRTTFSNGDHHRIGSDNAQKVFEVAGMGIATYGWAFLKNDTIAGVMDQFAAHLDDVDWEGVEGFAAELGAFYHRAFEEHLAEAEIPWDEETMGFPLGFLVAGYGEDGIGAIYEVYVPVTGAATLQATTTGGGSMWRGQTDVIRRLIKGIDLQGLSEQQLELEGEALEKASQLEYNPLPTITLQDGIDYASFLVRTTVDMQRFSDGTYAAPGEVPGCGGPLQVLAVERSRPVWVKPLVLHGPSDPGLAEGAPA